MVNVGGPGRLPGGRGGRTRTHARTHDDDTVAALAGTEASTRAVKAGPVLTARSKSSICANLTTIKKKTLR